MSFVCKKIALIGLKKTNRENFLINNSVSYGESFSADERIEILKVKIMLMFFRLKTRKK